MIDLGLCNTSRVPTTGMRTRQFLTNDFINEWLGRCRGETILEAFQIIRYTNIEPIAMVTMLILFDFIVGSNC